MIYFPRWKVGLILVICLLGIAYLAPNFMSYQATQRIPTWLPHQQINLGLDLRGGSHLLLEVGVQDVIEQRLESLVDSVRVALRGARIGYVELGKARGRAVQFTVRDPADLEAARQAVRTIEPNAELRVERNRIILELPDSMIRELTTHAVQQSIEIVRRRIDETGVSEPSIQRQGADRILVQLPGVDDPERIKRLLGQTAQMTFRLVDTSVSSADLQAGRAPPGTEILPADDEVHPVTGEPVRYAVQRRVMVSGETLVDAQPTFQEGRPVVSFRFDSAGARRFADATSRNVGRPFAIVLDGKVISAPVIREPILGGSGVITGRFTVQEVNDLALLLRAGALPAPLIVLEERTVGPGLGADSIRAGEIASVIAIVLVVAFMFASYGRFGLMADVALVMNLVLLGAVLSALQATLTLPGIAGIVLTIGMSVDANVLIFERIREEQRNGRTPIAAVDAGFQRAFRTILDANITTLIAAVLLFQFGSGPVRGFAVTLAIGLVTSMFCALMLTRLLVVTWLRRTRPKLLPI